MTNFRRFLKFSLWSLLGLVAFGVALFGTFIYSPAPEVPSLSGALTKRSIEVGGLKRVFRTYVPLGLPKGAPLVVVMHGSGQNGSQIRLETGYGFDRLADEKKFAVVYPNAASFDWNDCSKVGDFKAANGLIVDEVAFLGALVDQLGTELGTDRARVFATGVSSGGFMSIRLALEASSRFRAVAAVSANLQTQENCQCKPLGKGTSVMFLNGTQDPLVPFEGGEASLFGLFYKSGQVRSSRASADYFAALNNLEGAPKSQQLPTAGGVQVERLLWQNDSKVEVELLAIQGGGHGLPQPHWRRPRLLGPSPMEPNGPALIWAFFERQRP